MSEVINSFEERIKNLEEIEAIRNLKATYCYAVDSKNWQQTAELFTENADADFGPFGQYKGRENVATFFRNLPQGLPLCIHMIHNPLIKVEGDTATGVWYFEVPGTLVLPAGETAVWIQGRYNEEYIKLDGEWKIKKLVCTFHYITPIEIGWVNKPMVV
jgi:hypothetical protein